MPTSKEAKRLYDQAYRESNSTMIKAKKKAYREANPEKIAAKKHAYWMSNKEKERRRKQAWAEANKERLSAKRKAWEAANEARLKAKRKAYYAANAEKSKAKSAAYRAANPEKIKVLNHEHYEANKAHRLAWQHAYTAAHKERIDKRNKAWRDAHPENMAEIRAHRRAREAGAPIVDLSPAQWREIQAAQDHRCAYCGKRCKGRLTRDHITPVGPQGPHTLTNIVGACQSCNSKKWTGPPITPVQPLLLSIAAPKKKKAS